MEDGELVVLGGKREQDAAEAPEQGLLCTASPVVGESMPGYLARLGVRNGIGAEDEPRFRQYMLNSKTRGIRQAFCPSTSACQRIARLANVATQAVADLSLAARCALWSDGGAFQSTAQWYRRSPYCKYCSECVEAEQVHLRWWSATGSVVCLRHGTVLAQRCPDCGCPVSIQSVVQGRCLGCASALARPPVKASAEVLDIQGQLWRALNGERGPCSGGLSPAAFAHIYDLLRATLVGGMRSGWVPAREGVPVPPGCGTVPEPVRGLARVGTTAQSVAVAVIVSRSLSHLPNSWIALMEDIRRFPRVEQRPAGWGIMKEFDPFLSRCRKLRKVHPGDFQPVLAALDHYLVHHWKGGPLLRTPNAGRGARSVQTLPRMTVLRAAKLIGVAHHTVYSRIAAGALEARKLSTRKRACFVVPAKEVERLRDELQERMSVTQVARRLGMAHKTISRLVAAGSLPVHPAPERPAVGYTFRRADVERVIRGWRAGMCPPLPDDSPSIRWRSAAMRLGDTQTLIRHLLAGKLRGDANAREPGNWLVVEASIDAIRPQVQRPRVKDEDLVRVSHVARLLGISGTAVSGLVAAGRLPAHCAPQDSAMPCAFRRPEIERLIRSWRDRVLPPLTVDSVPAISWSSAALRLGSTDTLVGYLEAGELRGDTSAREPGKWVFVKESVNAVRHRRVSARPVRGDASTFAPPLEGLGTNSRPDGAISFAAAARLLRTKPAVIRAVLAAGLLRPDQEPTKGWKGVSRESVEEFGLNYASASDVAEQYGMQVAQVWFWADAGHLQCLRVPVGERPSRWFPRRALPPCVQGPRREYRLKPADHVTPAVPRMPE